ncbi:glycoside hydrolase family 3 protein, partial [Candidatus Parcubacteria bacterium]|nr:glycoside hydrolase family 3 protein [Candidatus Parcubacteria bacterium]
SRQKSEKKKLEATQANKKENIEEELGELKEKIGQMIMIGFRGTEIKKDSHIVKVIKDLKIGGVILFDFDVPSKSFPRNILNPNQTKKLISDLQGFSKIPLFVAVDAEGGRVNRLKKEYGFLEIPSHQKLGQIDNLEFTKEKAQNLSQQLKELGFNMNFAPVLDLNLNPQNPIIGKLERSFSSDPEKVFLHAKAFILAHIKNNIIPVAKHFPGHGSSRGDTHFEIEDITETFQEKELMPYKKLEKENLLKVVMVGHLMNKNLDEKYPASLSKVFIENILRKEIGFEGIVISDDLGMKAISKNFSLEEAILQAIQSGVNILLFSNNTETGYDENLPYKVVDIILQAVKDGKIKKERILESYEKIIKLKKEFEIIN